MRTRTALFITTGLAALAIILATRLPAQSDRAEAQQNPFTGQPAAIAAGKTLYTAQCQNCHATGIATYPHGTADGEIFLNIRNGIRNTAMQSYTQLSTDQIWQIIAYMKTLTLSTPQLRLPSATTYPLRCHRRHRQRQTRLRRQRRLPHLPPVQRQRHRRWP